MAQILVLCTFGVIVTEIYIRTRRPKLYAFLNSAAGVGTMLLMQYIAGGFAVNAYNSALSAILGIPGAVLLFIVNITGG